MRVALLLAAATAAVAADRELLDHVRSRVRENTNRIPRYTCRQTVNRTEYRSRHLITWHDRLRLDVAVLDGVETFSWAGAHQFDTKAIDQLTASGSSGSGSFAAFLVSVFVHDSTRITPLGPSQFAFEVPVESSGYVYRGPAGNQRVIGFHGSFLVDETTAELKRLTVEADHFPADDQISRVEDVMDYHTVRIGDGDFLLPENASMDVLFKSGAETRNETRFSDCREYVAESSIHFGDDDPKPPAPVPIARAPQPLPSGTRLDIGLQSPIDSGSAAAGDRITGIVLHGPRKNETVQGRILRLEQFLFPLPRWVVEIQFDPIATPRTFTFAQRGNLVLDRKFHAVWVVP
jgi:hypothetical protein